jgi:hypothetical protein
LCKIKEPDYIEITAMAQILHSFYSSELKWKDMEQLTKNIEELWIIIKEDFNNFINNYSEIPPIA